MQAQDEGARWWPTIKQIPNGPGADMKLQVKASELTSSDRDHKPIVMNVKGASASGKSTMRPLQRILAGKLNFPWEEFALISPDIWRKFLLDYGSLGPTSS